MIFFHHCDRRIIGLLSFLEEFDSIKSGVRYWSEFACVFQSAQLDLSLFFIVLPLLKELISSKGERSEFAIRCWTPCVCWLLLQVWRVAFQNKAWVRFWSLFWWREVYLYILYTRITNICLVLGSSKRRCWTFLDTYPMQSCEKMLIEKQSRLPTPSVVVVSFSVHVLYIRRWGASLVPVDVLGNEQWVLI